MKKHLKDIFRKSNQEDKSKFKYVLTQNERNYPLDSKFVKEFFSTLSQKDICFYPNTLKLVHRYAVRYR